MIEQIIITQCRIELLIINNITTDQEVANTWDVDPVACLIEGKPSMNASDATLNEILAVQSLGSIGVQRLAVIDSNETRAKDTVAPNLGSLDMIVLCKWSCKNIFTSNAMSEPFDRQNNIDLLCKHVSFMKEVVTEMGMIQILESNHSKRLPGTFHRAILFLVIETSGSDCN